jgi:hypothetical protein
MDTRMDAVEATSTSNTNAINTITSGAVAGTSDTLVNTLNAAIAKAAGLAIALG